MTTVKAAPGDLARFLQHHLAIGATHITLCLDDPDAPIPDGFDDDPRVRFVPCDAAYWARLGHPRPNTHRERQKRNATEAYRQSRLDWLAHIDIDEFLLPRGQHQLGALLAAQPPDRDALHILPAEFLGEASRRVGQPLFKRKIPLHQARAGVSQQIYPQFGGAIRSGFLGHVEGKALIRTGLAGVDMGIHRPYRADGRRYPTHPLRHILLGHAHVRSEAEFLERTPDRLVGGGYAPFGCERRAQITRLIETELAQNGEAGLRAIYREFYGQSPRFIAALRQHGLLFRARAYPALMALAPEAQAADLPNG